MSDKQDNFLLIDKKWLVFAQDDLKIVKSLYQQKEKVQR